MAREGLRERAAIYKYHKVFDGYNFLSGPKGMEEIVSHDMELVSLEDHEEAIKQTRQDALREIRQFCVDYEDCCVLGLVAHADKAVTNASISTTQFIKRHIDDRLAQEG